jgi:hypothetical protein
MARRIAAGQDAGPHADREKDGAVGPVRLYSFVFAVAPNGSGRCTADFLRREALSVASWCECRSADP